MYRTKLFFLLSFTCITVFSCQKDEYIELISSCLDQFDFPRDIIESDYYLRSQIGKDSLNLSVSGSRSLWNVSFSKSITSQPSLDLGDSSKVNVRGMLLSLGNNLSEQEEVRFYIRAYGLETMEELVDAFYDAYLNDDVELQIRDHNSQGVFNIGVTIPCYDDNAINQSSFHPIDLNTEQGQQLNSWLKISAIQLLESKGTHDLHAITFDFRCQIYDDKDVVLNFSEEISGQFKTEIRVDK